MSSVTVRIEDMSAQDLSHELNTSLTGIKGVTELLDMSERSHEIQAELRVMHESNQRLEKIINKILNNIVEIVSIQNKYRVSPRTQFFV